jgi:hypothetical protein
MEFMSLCVKLSNMHKRAWLSHDVHAARFFTCETKRERNAGTVQTSGFLLLCCNKSTTLVHAQREVRG